MCEKIAGVCFNFLGAVVGGLVAGTIAAIIIVAALCAAGSAGGAAYAIASNLNDGSDANVIVNPMYQASGKSMDNPLVSF